MFRGIKYHFHASAAMANSRTQLFSIKMPLITGGTFIVPHIME